MPTYPFYPYYYAAYGIAALIYIAYAFSLHRRARSLRDRTPPR